MCRIWLWRNRMWSWQASSAGIVLQLVCIEHNSCMERTTPRNWDDHLLRDGVGKLAFFGEQRARCRSTATGTSDGDWNVCRYLLLAPIPWCMGWLVGFLCPVDISRVQISIRPYLDHEWNLELTKLLNVYTNNKNVNSWTSCRLVIGSDFSSSQFRRCFPKQPFYASSFKNLAKKNEVVVSRSITSAYPWHRSSKTISYELVSVVFWLK